MTRFQCAMIGGAIGGSAYVAIVLVTMFVAQSYETAPPDWLDTLLILPGTAVSSVLDLGWNGRANVPHLLGASLVGWAIVSACIGAAIGPRHRSP